MNVFSVLNFLFKQITHNHHTFENSVEKGCNGPSWRQENEKKTIGPYLSAAAILQGFLVSVIYVLLTREHNLKFISQEF